MKRVLSAAVLGALTALALSAAPGAAQATRIGYVNSQKVIAEAPAAMEATRTLESEATRYRTQVDSLEKALQARQTSFESRQATLAAAAKTQEQQAIQQQFQAYQQRVQTLEQTMQRRQQELMTPVMRRINEVIEAVRKEQNVGIVLDASSGAMLSADPALDMTDTVLARLKQGVPAAAPAPGPRRP